ncbi:uncharacterized protein LOC119839346 [Zerene cesonia]|uniref:uncharacterized protein LOC119839346 n=1 Tax=Zerene cesonia TaxID=33412 RepID=UPI0018E4ECFC|nr:uncharacterized protein LOC119839346 [Zerene cesonia]
MFVNLSMQDVLIIHNILNHKKLNRTFYIENHAIKARGMTEESSNDASVVAIISDEEDDSYSDKPIIKLFKRLIANDSKQNTILTNNQILDLLKLEFDIDILVLHSLEVDIYITLMKRFLKDWPQWEDFDNKVNEAKKKNEINALKNMLQEKHDNLKEYLRSVIDIAKPRAKEAVLKAKEHIKNNTEMPKNDGSDNTNAEAILEVDASRWQLDHLFLRLPVAGSIFNVDPQPPYSKITVNNFKTEAMLNWWNMNIEIRLRNKGPNLLYRREMIHELRHTLVNKILPNQNNPCIKLDQELQVKMKLKSRPTESPRLIDFIDKIASMYPVKNCDINEVFEFVKKDLFLMPQKVFTAALYKRYLNEYSYVRYHYVMDDNGNLQDKYDIQLEEIVLPMVKFNIAAFDVKDVVLDATSLIVECSTCKESFTGAKLLTELREHFGAHPPEKPWLCTNCGLEFPMLLLAERWWSHRCQ